LLEARLVKDIQPRFNVELKDDKTFPYLQIRIREDFPRVEFTRTPRRRGVKLYGPFTSAKSLRAAMQVLQRLFTFRTCSLEIKALKKLSLRGDVDKDVQPEVFHIDPKKGLAGLRKVLGLAQKPRTIEGIDIAHLGGGETVASLVSFIDGLPFKPGYRRYRIKT